MAMNMAYVTNAPPSPTQAGIVSNCVRWMKSYDVDKDDTCADFSHRAQDSREYFYSLNPFLGKNGENCSALFWANYWYCITAKDPAAAAAATVVTVTPTPTPTAAAVKTTLQSIIQSSYSATSSTPTTSATQQSVYEPKDHTYVGCASEPSNWHALTVSSYQYSKQTVDFCVAACDSKKYSLSGLKNGIECWCGNKIDTGSKVEPGVIGKCTTPCGGDGRQMCGGGKDFVSVYKRNGAQVKVRGVAAAKKEKRVAAAAHADLGPHATSIGVDGQPTVVKTVKMIRRGRFARRIGFP